MPDFSPATKTAFKLSVMEAQALGSRHVDTEHLFLGFCKTEGLLGRKPETSEAPDKAQPNDILQEIKNFSALVSGTGLDCKKARRRLRAILAGSQTDKGAFSGHRTERCRQVFAVAENACTETGETLIGMKEVMAAVLRQPSSPLDMLFSQLSVNREDLLRSVSQKEAPDKEASGAGRERSKPLSPFLSSVGRDLTGLARKGKLEPAIGRKGEIKKVVQILSQKKKKNPILVGDPGVGKTCVVEGLALEVVKPDAPPFIRRWRIVEISMSAMVSGARLRGEFEEKMQMLVNEASSDPNLILFFDEIHTMVGAGGSGGMDAGNILKPPLARGAIRCIGATTTAEYRKTIEKDPALERRFQRIWVDEPTREEAIFILRGIRSKFEAHYGMTIPDKTIEKAVELSMRYLTDFRLPDKAIDIIDQGCSRNMFKTLSPSDPKGKIALTLEDLAEVIAERCRIPVENLTAEEGERFLRMEEYLEKRVMGQEAAVREVAETLRSARAGLKDPRKPMGVFLFLGSTGTGKTELAKALAELLFFDEKRLIVFDMSEYKEKGSINKLIGSPPGYIGHEEEGQLTRRVRTNPYSVVLFDEIEKADPQVFDIFLQIFDEGRLTDAHDRRVSFSEAVIILTSNLGSSLSQEKSPIGFNAETVVGIEGTGIRGRNAEICENREAYEERIYEAVTQTFRPELLNRIQKRIVFYPLGKKTVGSIMEKIVGQMNQRLSSRDIRIFLSEAARGFLMDAGYSEAYGAREMNRAFEKHVFEPLSRKIIRGDVKPGQEVEVLAGPEGLQLRIIG